MNPELGLGWFRIAVFITGVSGILALIEPPDSAEFVISVASFGMGLLFIFIIVVIVKRSS
ncbi:MAG: hypothetical protein HZB51_16965 [Chloroflexi bacterium]|nr:hypothetical protein [Chloroflexota bacterium]